MCSPSGLAGVNAPGVVARVGRLELIWSCVVLEVWLLGQLPYFSPLEGKGGSVTVPKADMQR